jgi:hypothetical protein
LVLDPLLGVRATSLGIADGRIVALGRAGNPDVMDGVGVVLDTATASSTPPATSSPRAAWTRTSTGSRRRWRTPRSPAG